MTDPQAAVPKIKERVAAQRENIIQFLRDLCAIPSYDSKIGPVGERAAAEQIVVAAKRRVEQRRESVAASEWQPAAVDRRRCRR